MRTRGWLILLAAACLSGVAREARAELHLLGFVGAATSPQVRPARGFSAGVTALAVGFELEYGTISEDAAKQAPALTTGTISGILQTPMQLKRLQLYLTLGGGLYRETLDGSGKTGLAVSYGGGARIGLIGPLRARVDYRLFRLSGSAREPHAQRVYVGLGLSL